MENAVNTSCVAASTAAADDGCFVLCVAGARVGTDGAAVVDGLLLLRFPLLFAVVGVDGACDDTAAGDDGGVPNKPNNLSVAGALVILCGGSVDGGGGGEVTEVVVVVAGEGCAGVPVGVAVPLLGVVDVVVFDGDEEELIDNPANKSDIFVLLARLFEQSHSAILATLPVT